MHKSLTLFCLVLALAGTLSACATFTGFTEVTRPLVEPVQRSNSEALTQALHITWQGETHQLLGVLEMTPGNTAMAVFTPEGLTLFSLVHNATGLTVDRHQLLPTFVDPRRILADAQLVNWPLPELISQLPAPWRVEEEGLTRRLWCRQKLISEAVFQGSISSWETVELKSPGGDFKLMIQPLRQEIFN